MNKLDIWKAQIADLDALKRHIMFPPTSIDEVDMFPVYEEKVAAVDWDAIVRALLPIAEAAEELRYDISFVDEHSKCVSCGTRFDKPHTSNCTVRQLQDALDRLEE